MIPKLEVARQRLLVAPLAGIIVRRRGAVVEKDAIFFGMPIVEVFPGSTVSIGPRSTLVSHSWWTDLGVAHPVVLRTLNRAAAIRIGSDCGLSGTTICAAGRVTIGDRVLMGADVVVSDTDFHPVDAVPRAGLPVPTWREEDAVVVEDDVFLGTRSTLLKGVRIGQGSVIGAGSVVTRSIPPFVIAGGNPARVLRSIRAAP